MERLNSLLDINRTFVASEDATTAPPAAKIGSAGQQEEPEYLRAAFDAIDAEGNGWLSVAELTAAVYASTDKVDASLAALDTTSSGRINAAGFSKWAEVQGGTVPNLLSDSREIKLLDSTSIIATVHTRTDEGSSLEVSPAIRSRFTVIMVGEYSDASKELVVRKLLQECPCTSCLAAAELTQRATREGYRGCE